MFMALDIDRYNIGNATADNLLGDLGLTQADYSARLSPLRARARVCVAPEPSR